MTRIKICGLSDASHVIAAAELGVDFIGFVFAASKRQVTPLQAQKLISAVADFTSRPDTVGVFVNSQVDEVNEITDQCRLDLVQLSGNESFDYCRQIRKPLIKVIHVAADDTKERIANEIEQGYRLFSKDRLTFLLDTKSDGLFGGSGKMFNWHLIERITAEFPVIVAGGLTPDNVGALIKQAKPWGVDVSSGVEIDGKKDINEMRRFVEIVRKENNIESITRKEKDNAARQ